MFPFIDITPPLARAKIEILTRLFPDLEPEFAARLIGLEEAIAKSDTATSVSLSLRQLIRLWCVFHSRLYTTLFSP